MGTGSQKAKSGAGRAQSSSTMKVFARIGYAMYGVVHLVLGWIVIQMGLGSGNEEDASADGALAEIASQPFGRIALAVVAIGLMALVIWRVLIVVGDTDTKERIKAAGKAVIHLAIAVLAAGYALGVGGSGADEEGLTSEVMSYPAGRIAIAAIGAGILIAGIVHLVIGTTKSFLDGMNATGHRQASNAVVVIGRVGYWAKGVAFAVLGGLFGLAAWNADPEEAGGLDEAFAAIGEQPYGSVLLIITGAGLAAFGLFCFAQARYLRL